MSIGQKFKEFIAPMDEDDVLEVEQEEDVYKRQVSVWECLAL